MVTYLRVVAKLDIARLHRCVKTITTAARCGQTQWCCCIITDKNTGIAITHRAILGFVTPRGRQVPPIIAKFGTSGRYQTSPAPCQISRRSVNVWWFLTQKKPKNPKFCKLVRPVWGYSLLDIHKIYRFCAPVGSMKMFQICCHSMHNWWSYKQKTTVCQFSPKILQAPSARTVGCIQQSWGCKKWDRHSLSACKVRWKLVHT